MRGFEVRTNTLVTLGASAAFGILAIVIARGWVNDAVSSQYQQSRADTSSISLRKKVNTVPVLVADMDLNFGDYLTPQSVRLVDYPEDAVPLGSYTEFDNLFTDLSLPTVSLTRMVMNEPVLDFKISGPGGRGSLSALIGEDMRAVSIRVNDVAGVGGFIVPGDHVDVMMTRDHDPEKPGGEKITNLLIQNLKVLGTDQNNDQQSAAPQVVQTVTLEVKNEEAQKLILAMTVGKLSLTLRRVGETDADPATEVTVADLNSMVLKRKPVRRRSVKTGAATRSATIKKPAGSSASVTVIRNGERDQVKVKKAPETEPKMAGGSL